MKKRWWMPPLRFYRSPIVQGVAIFFGFVGYGHHDWPFAWALGGYLFAIGGMTAAWAQDEMWRRLPRSTKPCPTCGGSGSVSINAKAALTDEPLRPE